jgi:NAD/NADP transhydrogenase beta subunit
MLSVALLHTLLAPVYFALRLSRSPFERPYGTLLKLIAIYAVATRAMIIPTYWLARIYEWPESRFAGLAGPDVSPVTGFVVVPVATAAIWIVASIVIGGLVGAIVLKMVRLQTMPAR